MPCDCYLETPFPSIFFGFEYDQLFQSVVEFNERTLICTEFEILFISFVRVHSNNIVIHVALPPIVEVL